MPSVVRMNVRDFPRWMRNLSAQYPKAIRTGLRRAAQRSLAYVTTTAINTAEPYPPVDRGMYRRAWKVQDTPEGARLLNDMPYAAVIEYGRRPGRMPPVDVLAGWVRRKFGLKEKEARGIAFAIARKIAAKGTAPRFVILNSFPEFRQYTTEEVRLAIMEVNGL